MTMTDIKALVARLRSDLPVCPADRRSPDYWTMPRDAPCVVCGGEAEGPDKCRGADTRCMTEAADALEAAQAEIVRLREALDKLARLGNEPHYGNSVGNDIARRALGDTYDHG